MPIWYSTFVDVVAKVFLGLGILAGAICLLDWLIRERKISPFSGLARFFRNRVDPLMRPVENRIVRMGGMPSAAPLWVLVGIAVLGIVVIQLLRFIGGLLMQVSIAAAHPQLFPMLLLHWAVQLLIIAILVRVISSWLPVSPYSKWIRWSYVTTEWLLAPIRRVVPGIRVGGGMVDISPLIAYLLITVVSSILGIQVAISRVVGGVRIDVHVQPRAKRNEIAGCHGEAIKVRLTAVPADGKANEALIELLATAFARPLRSVRIISGARSRAKIVEIDGVGVEDVRRLIRTGND